MALQVEAGEGQVDGVPQGGLYDPGAVPTVRVGVREVGALDHTAVVSQAHVVTVCATEQRGETRGEKGGEREERESERSRETEEPRGIERERRER